MILWAWVSRFLPPGYRQLLIIHLDHPGQRLVRWPRGIIDNSCELVPIPVQEEAGERKMSANF